MDEKNKPFYRVYYRLREHYGHQQWWPAEDEFEVMIGAILTQNTSWSNVEKAIHNLKQHDCCDAESLAAIKVDTLAQMIRSSGYFNQKAQRLKHFTDWYLAEGGYSCLVHLRPDELRRQLLKLKGIGDETADDICLYAFHHPCFVIDNYTRRIFSRLGLINSSQKYRDLQTVFHAHLTTDTKLFQQYHALIVEHAKQHCQKKPKCNACPLMEICQHEQDEN